MLDCGDKLPMPKIFQRRRDHDPLRCVKVTARADPISASNTSNKIRTTRCFRRACWLESAYDIAMAAVHPFTFRIEADPLSERRFRWTVREGDQVRLRSPHSYATRREAEADANKAMLRLAVNQPRRDDWTI